jgi:hypothetical protein
VKFGISEATYYRRKAAAKKSAAENAKNSLCERFVDHTLTYFPMDKSVSGETRHRAAGDHVSDRAPASRPAPPRSTPVSFDQPDREGSVIEVPAAYGAEFSEVEAERARRIERIQRALAVCERAFTGQFGQPLETDHDQPNHTGV